MRKVAVLIGLMSVVGTIGYQTYKHEGLPSRSNMKELGNIYSAFVGPTWKYRKNDKCQTRYPFKKADNYGWWFCMANSQEKPTLLLLGNSYANHLYPGMVHHQALKHHHVLSIGTCEPSWVEKSDLNENITDNPCSGFRQLDQMKYVNSIIRKEKSIRYVVMSGLPTNPDSNYIDRLRKRIDYIEKNNVNVILFVPHMRIDYDIKGCYGRPPFKASQTCEVSVDAYKTLLKNFGPLTESIKKTNPSVLIFDQNTVFCDEKKCAFKMPLMPAFRDEYAHFSEFGSQAVINAFVEWAKINVPDIVHPESIKDNEKDNGAVTSA